MVGRMTVKREGEFEYPILFSEKLEGLASSLEEVGLSGKKCLLVSDSHVAPLYMERTKQALKEAGVEVFPFIFPAGEIHKTLNVIQEIYEAAILAGLDRGSFFAALGGGVVGDMTGFAAATYLRGVVFIQLPTTLLAMVDSSVGGKTGVDFSSYKNMVGAFHQPRLVYMAMDTLQSLNQEQFACGMGEVVKTALICDRPFYEELKEKKDKIQERDKQELARVIQRCCEIKAHIVEQDPKEQGIRAYLNLGHTIGHAIEKSMDYTLLHGQCVAIGLMACARISQQRGLLGKEELEDLRRTLIAFDLPYRVTLREWDLQEGLKPETVLLATKKDKKMDKGRVKFVLLRSLGEAFVDRTVTDEELLDGICFVLDDGNGDSNRGNDGDSNRETDGGSNRGNNDGICRAVNGVVSGEGRTE